jgi:hypothetical protein
MPTLIARLRRRPLANQPLQSHAPPATTPIRRSMPGAWAESSPFERKIHPDLNSLIIDDTEPDLVSPSTVPFKREETTLGFVPLLPSTRKRSASFRTYLAEDSGENNEKAQAIEQPSSNVSGQTNSDAQRHSTHETNSPPVDVSFPNTSGETFGGTEKLTLNQSTSRVVTDTRSTPVTPDGPELCSLTGTEVRHIRTPSLCSQPHSIQDVASSPHTFGIPTPPSSGFTFGPRHRRIQTSSETPPPLPPLDHPAFQSSGNVSRAMRVFSAPSLLLEGDEQVLKQPRHAWSLPTMSRKALSNTKGPKHSGKRGRSQSKIKVQETLSSPSRRGGSFRCAHRARTALSVAVGDLARNSVQPKQL